MISFDENLGMPDLTYGWAKLTHEYCARLAYEKHGLKSVTYRPFSGYGEDQDDTYPFPSILEAISFSHASLLNIAEVSRECEVSRKTVEGYVSVLEDMLLGCRLHVFARRAKRKLIKQVKFYFSDCGVFRSIRPKGPLDRPEEMDGAALEGLVYQHLKAWLDYSEESNELFFWRTQSGTEVDFVVYGESQFCALEVKNSRRVDRKGLRALKTFKSDYPECKAALLYRGNERLLVDGVWCLPSDEFLRNLVPGGISCRNRAQS